MKYKIVEATTAQLETKMNEKEYHLVQLVFNPSSPAQPWVIVLEKD